VSRGQIYRLRDGTEAVVERRTDWNVWLMAAGRRVLALIKSASSNNDQRVIRHIDAVDLATTRDL